MDFWSEVLVEKDSSYALNLGFSIELSLGGLDDSDFGVRRFH